MNLPEVNHHGIKTILGVLLFLLVSISGPPPALVVERNNTVCISRNRGTLQKKHAVVIQQPITSALACALRCCRRSTCESFAYDKLARICELYDVNRVDLVPRNHSVYYGIGSYQDITGESTISTLGFTSSTGEMTTLTTNDTTADLTTEPTTIYLTSTHIETSSKTTAIDLSTTNSITNTQLTTDPTTEELPTTTYLTTFVPTSTPSSTTLETDQTTTEQTSTEIFTTEQTTTEQTTTEQQTTDHTTTEQQTTDHTTTEQKTTDQSTTEQLTTDQSTTEQLTTEQTTKEQLTTEQTTKEQLTTEQTTTEQITTDTSTLEQTSTELTTIALETTDDVLQTTTVYDPKVPGTCPINWVIFNGKCVRLLYNSTKLSWTESNLQCNHLKGHLITFVYHQLPTIYTIFDVVPDSGYAWIGCRRSPHFSSIWVYSTGVQGCYPDMIYIPTEPFQIDTTDPNIDVIAYTPGGIKGYDVTYTLSNYICERPLY